MDVTISKNVIYFSLNTQGQKGTGLKNYYLEGVWRLFVLCLDSILKMSEGDQYLSGWCLCCVISLKFQEGVVWKVSGKGPQDIRGISKGCHEEGFLRLLEWCLEDVEKNSKWYLL